MSVLGLDIGGANLKAATSAGWSASYSFPLWRKRDELAEALQGLIGQAPRATVVAITMTGELADCFSNKAEGVRFICDAAREAAGARQLFVYSTDGSFVTHDDACRDWLGAAASNWHALANYAARNWQIESGVLLDLGSTTCDIIPIHRRRPVAQGRTDPERLLTGELVYTGVVRSPVCAVVREFPFCGKLCAVAQEVFATTLDAYLLLGDIPENPGDLNTADGRPATRERAHDRLARCVCADRESFSFKDATSAAESIKIAQLAQVATAATRVIGAMVQPPAFIILSGQGEFLLKHWLDRPEICEQESVATSYLERGEKNSDRNATNQALRTTFVRSLLAHSDRLAAHVAAKDAGGALNVVSLAGQLGPQLSRVATAYAIAVLAEAIL